MRHRRRAGGGDRGSAVVDFVLVLLVLVPLFLGIAHLALVLHVRNTLTSAASEGARYGAVHDRAPTAGATRTRQVMSGVLAQRHVREIEVGETHVDGYPAVRVTVRAEVPPLGLWGPRTEVRVHGHAVAEDVP